MSPNLSTISIAALGCLAATIDASALGARHHHARQFGGFGRFFGGHYRPHSGGPGDGLGGAGTGSAAIPTATGGASMPAFSSVRSEAAPAGTAPVASAPAGSAAFSAQALAFTSSVVVADYAQASSAALFSNSTASAGYGGYAASSAVVAAGSAAAVVTGSAAATTTFPEASGTSTLSEPMTVTGTFDGGMYSFGRGVSCDGQEEGGDSDAVFELEDGATLQNVIIGADQMEGVHCLGSCTIKNVWWVAVCEDALTLRQESGTSYVIGGGAQGADDKVIQHNGGGTVSISGFYVADFGKLYRSCGNCDEMYERHVIIDSVVADSGSVLAGINSNYGDTATITNTCATDVETICAEYEGNDTGDEPDEISEGPSDYCIYTTSDVSVC